MTSASGFAARTGQDLPAPWERAQPLRAVGLALEAVGIPFCTVDSEEVVGSGVQLPPVKATGCG
jgi:hypothetical protein